MGLTFHCTAFELQSEFPTFSLVQDVKVLLHQMIGIIERISACAHWLGGLYLQKFRRKIIKGQMNDHGSGLSVKSRVLITDSVTQSFN